VKPEAQHKPVWRKTKNPAHIDLAAWLRQEITSGALPSGHRFAPTQELARLWQTYPIAVHRALQQLAQENLVERLHRKGTFVRQDYSKLGTILLYIGTDIMSNEYLRFLRNLLRLLKERLDESKINYRIVLDHRSDDEQDGTPCRELVRLTKKQDIAGLIALAADTLRMTGLKKLGLPLVAPSDIQTNLSEIAALAIEGLAVQGCRRAGALIPRGVRMQSFAKNFIDEGKARGIDVHPQWIVTPVEYIPDSFAEEGGYRLFCTLWEQEEKPDGLFVYPDIMVPGVVAAIAQVGLKVPEQLKLTVHKNREINVFCPYPAMAVVNDLSEYATLMFEDLKRKIMFVKKPSALQIKPRLEALPQMNWVDGLDSAHVD